MLLEGKKALITGARKGIGRGIAVKFADEGADVGIADILDDEETQRTLAMVRDRGRKASLYVTDVSRSDAVGPLFEEFLADHERVDIVVNNAIMSGQSADFLEMTEEFWDRMVDLSLKGYFMVSQRAAREMVQQGGGGRIVCLSSVHGYRAWPGDTAYGICKAGLRRMVKSMAVDLAGTGITANCISPGYIDNKPSPEGLDEPLPQTIEDRPRLRSFVPSHRGGVPSDIAKAALMLCSDLGSYINGETLLVDGGLIAGGTPPPHVG